jgi:ribosomal protein L11 methyltransferase
VTLTQANRKRWLRVMIPKAVGELEALYLLCSELGSLGIHETETQLHLYFPAEQAERVLPELAEFMKIRQLSKVFNVDYLDDENWHLSWQKYFKIQRLSDRIVIRPYWESRVKDVPIELIIKPGMAFGTGTHATTQMALLLMDVHLQPRMQVLDAGCGNGILTIAALKMGARQVSSWDIDPDIEDNFYEHMTLNGIDTGYDLHIGDVTNLPTYPFDFIVSNIERKPNLALLESLRRVDSRVPVIFTGILKTEASGFQKVLMKARRKIKDDLFRDEWYAVVVE